MERNIYKKNFLINKEKKKVEKEKKKGVNLFFELKRG